MNGTSQSESAAFAVLYHRRRETAHEPPAVAAQPVEVDVVALLLFLIIARLNEQLRGRGLQTAEA